MNTVVFCGPTLSGTDGRQLLPDALFVPPAGCGDIHHRVRDGARLLVLLDGVFDHHLAVRHKEILWALSRGAVVCGASSMGALRAAELADFGMIGFGRVFSWYRDGHIEADDEVAVTHAPADRRWQPTSEALVNVRATCAQAVFERATTASVASAIVACGKRLFYPARTWSRILTEVRATMPAEVEAFDRWLGDGRERRIDIKKVDAIDLLDALARQRPEMPASVERLHHEGFSYTESWHELVKDLEMAPRVSGALVPRLDVSDPDR